MRRDLRFILPLICSVVVVSVLFAVYQVETERHNQKRDLERRAAILAESLQETVEPLFAKEEGKSLTRIVDRFGHREHLAGMGIYDVGGSLLAITSGLPAEFHTRPELAALAASQDQGKGSFERLDGTAFYIYALPLHRHDEVAGTLVLFHDATFIYAHAAQMWRETLANAAVQTLLIALMAFLLLRWTFTGPLKKTANWMKTLRLGHAAPPTNLPGGEVFDQLTHEVTHLARNLDAARAAAQEEAQLREKGESLWTAERLRVSVRSKLQNSPVFVLSNREPYMHVRSEKSTEIVVPPSGVVTALEPVLVACEGTWIAHGAGNADREAVDEHDHLRVPPDTPHYTLRRVWLSREEEQGFYFGFANEGLWPLCHTAHTRPIFRPEDWKCYQEVNLRFAQAVLEEMATTESPVLLAQDYHFALLPRLVKEARPDARVAIFWHIPWPNPEVFGICPWQRELLEGLLGADLIGFHTQFHCNNFLETVDRAIEALTEWDRFAVNRQGHLTWVRPFPISVAFADTTQEGKKMPPAEEERAGLLKELGVEGTLLGVGVDRVDYTKGILERFRGIEKFLETWPGYQRHFTFVQIGAPSRTDIRAYQNLLSEVAAEARRINARFEAGRWKPIVFLDKQHSHKAIDRLYRAADVCMVTSLHDGMNLVAKEFVAARGDERGVLILSSFTGASRELTDALRVNPYDVRQLAEAIRTSLEMSPEEQTTRMQRMRRIVREHNVYRWAGNLLADLCEIRVEKTERVEAS